MRNKRQNMLTEDRRAEDNRAKGRHSEDRHPEELALTRLLSAKTSAEEACRLKATWDDLDLPPAPDVPVSFRADVLEAVRGQQAGEVSWSGAPSWARAAAGAALALGMMVGLGIGQLPSSDIGPIHDAELDIYLNSYLGAEMESAPLSPADAFWLELEEEEEAL